MIADRWIDTHTAGQTRIGDMLADDKYASDGDEYRDAQKYERGGQ